MLFTTYLSQKRDETGKLVFQWDVHAQVEGNFAVVIKAGGGCCKKQKFLDMWENTAFSHQG